MLADGNQSTEEPIELLWITRQCLAKRGATFHISPHRTKYFPECWVVGAAGDCVECLRDGDTGLDHGGNLACDNADILGDYFLIE